MLVVAVAIAGVSEAKLINYLRRSHEFEPISFDRGRSKFNRQGTGWVPLGRADLGKRLRQRTEEHVTLLILIRNK